MPSKTSTAAEAVFNTGDDLGGLLRGMIDRSGMTRYQIAKAAGINQSTLSRAYSGERPATMELLRSVAGVLGRRVIVRVE
jgi:transcriptional regulator with XRE-family HTH domain